MARLGLIAGNGKFPLMVAEAARSKGISLFAIGIKGETSRILKRHVDRIEWVRLGEFKKMMNTFVREGIKEVVMAGQIKPRQLFNPRVNWDEEIKNLLKDIKNKKADTIFGSIADRFKEQGIELLDSTTYLADFLAKKGVLTSRKPSPAEWDDIYFGKQIAKAIAGLDVGQTVAVKGKAILAVEALEGTDATIIRAGKLAGGDMVVVKTSKPNQDMRFDIPVIGPKTIKTMIRAGARCLAIEADKTLIIDKSICVNLANKYDICIVVV